MGLITRKSLAEKGRLEIVAVVVGETRCLATTNGKDLYLVKDGDEMAQEISSLAQVSKFVEITTKLEAKIHIKQNVPEYAQFGVFLGRWQDKRGV